MLEQIQSYLVENTTDIEDLPKVREYYDFLESNHQSLPISAVEYKQLLTNVGRKYITLLNTAGDYSIIRSLAERILPIVEELQNEDDCAETYRMYASILQKHGLFHQAIEWTDKALFLEERLHNPARKALLLFNRGILFRATGRFQQAIHALNDSLQILDSIDDNRRRASCIGGLGNVYFDLQDHQTALEYFTKALAIEEEYGTPGTQSVWIGNIGRVYYIWKEYGKALEQFLQVIAIEEAREFHPTLSAWYGNTGLLYQEMKEYEKAIEFFHKALALAEKAGNIYEQGTWTGCLGTLFSKKEIVDIYDAKLAERHLLKSVTILTEIGNSKELCDFLFSLSQLYKNNRKWTKYAEYIERYHHTIVEAQTEEVRKYAEEHAFQQKIAEKEHLRQAEEAKNEALKEQNKALLEANNLIAKQNKELKRKNEYILHQQQLLETQSAELEQRNVQLQELAKFKELMLATIVHDLKNPLSTIINLAITENTSVHRNIEQAGRIMLTLVSNILDIQQLEEARMIVEKRPLNAEFLFQKVYSEVALFCQEKHLSVQIEIRSHYQLIADEKLIERILVNIMTNAIKYSHAYGNITMALVDDPLSDEYLLIQVEDNGRGIPEDKLPFVFERFEQAGQAEKIGSLGSHGLGLTFCKLAIEAQQGKITIKSVPEKGTTVTLYVPVSQKLQTTTTTYELIQESALSLLDDEIRIITDIAHEIHAQEVQLYQFSALMDIIEPYSFHTPFLQQWRSQLENIIFSGSREDFNAHFQIVPDWKINEIISIKK